MPSTSQDLSPVTYHPPCPLPEQTWEPIANPYSSLARLAQFHFLLLNASVTFRGYSSGGLVMWVRGTRPEDRFQGPKCSFSNGARNLLTVDLTRQEKETRIPELVIPVPPTLLTLDITAKMAASVMTVVSIPALDKLTAISCP